MSQPDGAVRGFVDALERAIDARAETLASVRPVMAKIFDACRASELTAGRPAGQRRAVCKHFAAAIANAEAGPAPLPDLARAFVAVEPYLAWAPRAGAEDVSDAFAARHANAVIVGEDGIAPCDGVRIGTSLVAPGTDYPRHRHPPEEVYLVLSPGSWMQDDQPMVARRTGDLVHNPPNVWHAMRAEREPLLAIWCLWTADA